MTHQQLRQPVRLAGAALAAITLLFTTPAWAGSAESAPAGPSPVASPAPSNPESAVTAQPMPTQPGPALDMAGQWQQMDARLDRLVEQMNRATGAAKVEAMAAVITELVSQREQMHRMAEQMRRGSHMPGMNQPARGEMMMGRGGAGTVPGTSPAAAHMCVRQPAAAVARSANESSS